MNKPDRHLPRRMVPVKPELASVALSLRPTSAFSRITDEALREWIEREQRRQALLAVMEGNRP